MGMKAGHNRKDTSIMESKQRPVIIFWLKDVFLIGALEFENLLA